MEEQDLSIKSYNNFQKLFIRNKQNDFFINQNLMTNIELATMDKYEASKIGSTILDKILKNKNILSEEDLELEAGLVAPKNKFEITDNKPKKMNSYEIYEVLQAQFKDNMFTDIDLYKTFLEDILLIPEDYIDDFEEYLNHAANEEEMNADTINEKIELYNNFAEKMKYYFLVYYGIQFDNDDFATGYSNLLHSVYKVFILNYDEFLLNLAIYYNNNTGYNIANIIKKDKTESVISTESLFDMDDISNYVKIAGKSAENIEDEEITSEMVNYRVLYTHYLKYLLKIEETQCFDSIFEDIKFIDNRAEYLVLHEAINENFTVSFENMDIVFYKFIKRLNYDIKSDDIKLLKIAERFEKKLIEREYEENQIKSIISNLQEKGSK